MSPERWEQVKRIVHACLEQAPGRRAAHASEVCGGDAELASAVNSLLESYDESTDFLETPALELEAAEDPAGTEIGPYRLVERIGEGGMGEVYRAVRASDFEKQVAIKLVKRGMDTDFLLRRFRDERQILAVLDHPNIARLIDGGAAAGRSPVRRTCRRSAARSIVPARQDRGRLPRWAASRTRRGHRGITRSDWPCAASRVLNDYA